MQFAAKPAVVALLRQGVDPAPRWARKDFALVAALTIAGLALRLPGLNHGLWLDEIWTLIDYVRLPLWEIISQFDNVNNHIFYSLAAHTSIALFGESAAALRLPALLFGVAAIPAIYYLGRQVSCRSEAFLAALFLAANYQHVWFSQNARGYTGLLLGALVLSSLFIQLLASTKPSSRQIISYAVAAALTTWLHLTAVVVIAAHGLIWLALAIKPIRAGRAESVIPPATALLLSGILILMLYAPVFQEVQHATQSSLSFDGPEGSLFISRPENVGWVLGEFSEGLSRTMPAGWLFEWVLIAALLAGSISYARQGAAVAGFLLLSTLTALALVAGFAQFFVPRFIFMSLGFLMLLAVRGGFVIAPRILPILSQRRVLVIGILLALVSASMVPAAWKPKQDFAGAADYVAEHRRAGDVVVCLGHAAFPLRALLKMDCKTVAMLSDLERLENRHQRIWLLYTLDRFNREPYRKIWQQLQSRTDYQLVKVFTGSLGGGDISLLLKQHELPATASRSGEK